MWGRLTTCAAVGYRRRLVCRRGSGPIDNRPQVNNLPHIDSPGGIVIRFPDSARSLLAEAVLKLVSEYASQLPASDLTTRN
jgi:hypothetical protein